MVAGCTPNQASIIGRVLLNGQPVPGGRLTFRPDDAKQPTLNVEVDEQGRFEAQLPVGLIHVSFDNREWAPQPRGASAGIAPPSLPPAVRNRFSALRASPPPMPPQPAGRYVKVPLRYTKSDNGELDFFVEPGKELHNIQLKRS
jgi:hypothetical protein